eukprot:scaffold49964_cov66-Phaeocystis_antarctica.AAC.1
MAILVAPRRGAAPPPALAATGCTGCRRDAQAREYRGERLKRARRPQNRAPSHLGAAWRQNGHSGCTTPRGGFAACARRHRSHGLQAICTGAGVLPGDRMAILVVPRREAVLPPPLAATGRTGCRRDAQARGTEGSA